MSNLCLNDMKGVIFLLDVWTEGIDIVFDAKPKSCTEVKNIPKCTVHPIFKLTNTELQSTT